jgi:hypothetical protein
VRQPDIARARDLLGWEPQLSVRDGLERTIAAATPRLGQPASPPPAEPSTAISS